MIDRFGLLAPATKNLFRITELKLLANPLGIRKIEIGPKGGRIIFEDKPNIDPLTVIKMVQSQPQRYAFDGTNKIRLTADLGDVNTRLQTVQQLLEQLGRKTH